LATLDPGFASIGQLTINPWFFARFQKSRHPTSCWAVQHVEVAIFEVDAPATQAVKQSAIEATGVDASRVTFVSCDFSRQIWLAALKEKGFRQDLRAFILWEGVTRSLKCYHAKTKRVQPEGRSYRGHGTILATRL
jgi:hypothetical protein